MWERRKACEQGVLSSHPYLETWAAEWQRLEAGKAKLRDLTGRCSDRVRDLSVIKQQWRGPQRPSGSEEVESAGRMAGEQGGKGKD